MRLITLRAAVPPRLAFEAPVHPRSIERSDRDALAGLDFQAYEPGVACATLGEAEEDIDATFAGEYGEPWLDASPVAEVDGAFVGAVLTVRRAPWGDAPAVPFMIEVFTAREHRRRSAVTGLVSTAMAVASAAGESGVAVRVADDNTGALELYRKLGFEAVD